MSYTSVTQPNGQSSQPQAICKTCGGISKCYCAQMYAVPATGLTIPAHATSQINVGPCIQCGTLTTDPNLVCTTCAIGNSIQSTLDDTTPMSGIVLTTCTEALQDGLGAIRQAMADIRARNLYGSAMDKLVSAEKSIEHALNVAKPGA